MQIGCHLPNQGPLATGDAVVTFAREAEKRQHRPALGQRLCDLPGPSRERIPADVFRTRPTSRTSSR